jgi:hypothetical protein
MTVQRPRIVTASSWEFEQLKIFGRGRSARLIAPDPLPRPSSAAVDSEGYLSWKWPTEKTDVGRARLRKIPPKLCFQFARLAEADDEGIRRAAERWGPLNYHRGKGERGETVSEWRKYAQLARAILRFVAQDFRGSDREADWKTIWNWVLPGQEVAELAVFPRKFRGTTTAMGVNLWYSRAIGNAIVQVNQAGFQVQPFGANLFGILIAQIAHMIARSDEAAICAGCRQAFNPLQPLSRGARRYCKSCRKKKVPERDASRDYRSRLKGSQPLKNP